MLIRCAIAALLLIPLAGVFCAEELTDASYERIKLHILPDAEDEAWRKIPWRTTFWQGVMDAQKEDKPIMLFAMNGHPFGCT
jgi:hypothetical protein